MDLDPQLVWALRDDIAAQARADEIVGLDFDPFLGGQDPCERYEVGTVRRDGPGYAVDVYGLCSGARQPQPDAVAVVVARRGAWRLVNVRYPIVHGAFVSALRIAHAERANARQ